MNLRSYNLDRQTERLQQFIRTRAARVMMFTPGGRPFRAVTEIISNLSGKMQPPFELARARGEVEFGQDRYAPGSLLVIGERRIAVEVPDESDAD